MNERAITDKEIKKYCSNKSDDSLEYIKNDCRESVSAMPENEKAIYYLRLAHGIERILQKRDRVRMYRRMQKENVYDVLTHPRVEDRKMIRNRNSDPYFQDRLKTAIIMLSNYKRFDLI